MKKPLRMFDSVTVSEIPAWAAAVAGYVGGQWQTFPKLVRSFPHAKKLSIAISASEDAQCLDIERGDAVNEEAPAWVKRQLRRGIWRPVVYTSVSNARALLQTLAAAGIKRKQVRLWTAHDTGHSHICGPACGFGNVQADATQWTFKSLGKNLDESLCSPGFFPTPVKRIVARVNPQRWLRYGHI